jgi:hypothetical protein
MENLSEIVLYYFNQSGTLVQGVFFFWLFAVVSFYASVTYGLTISLFNLLQKKFCGLKKVL